MNVPDERRSAAAMFDEQIGHYVANTIDTTILIEADAAVRRRAVRNPFDWFNSSLKCLRANTFLISCLIVFGEQSGIAVLSLST